MTLILDRAGNPISGPMDGHQQLVFKVAQARVLAAESVVSDRYGADAGRGVGLRTDAHDFAGKPGRVQDYARYCGEVQTAIFEMAGGEAAGALRRWNDAGKLRADHRETLGIRTDAVDFGAGGGGVAGNLTQWMAKIVEEPLPVLNMDKIAAKSNTLHPGALDYQILHIAGSGEAAFWTGGAGGDAYEVSEGIATYNLRQHWLLSQDHITLIDDARYNLLGFNREQRSRARLEFAHLSVHNKLFWQGNAKLKLLGLKNYPKLTKYGSGLSLASVTGSQLLNWCIQLLRRPVEDSAQRFTPNVLAVAPEVMTYMKELRVETGDAGVSVYKYLVDNFPGVSIEEYNELSDFFDTGVHGAIAFPRGSDASPTFESAPPYAVPIVQQGIGMVMYYISRVGGAFLPMTIGARMGKIEA